MKTLFRNFSQNPKNDILSGLTVALALFPEAVAFAFIAGIDPLVGLYGAFMMGIVTSIFGGRPGMISGATGAMAVVMVHMIQQGNEVGNALAKPIENLGLHWLFITLLIVGVIQISAGIFKLGKFVRLIPHSVMMGFVNGLAIVIFLSQLGLFQKNNWCRNSVDSRDRIVHNARFGYNDHAYHVLLTQINYKGSRSSGGYCECCSGYCFWRN